MTPQDTDPEPKGAAWTWALVLSPFALLLVFLTLAAHVRLSLGHWPTPMRENYGTPAFYLHQQVFSVALLFTVYSAFPLWLGTLCFRTFRISLKTHLMQAGVYLLGWGLIVLYVLVDPGKFVEWFMD